MRSKPASAILALLTAVSLSACAPDRGRPKVYLLSNDWKEISLAEADLTLLEELPLRATALHRSGSVESEVDDFLVFRGDVGVSGYILTSRRPGSSFPEETMLEMRQARLFHAHARQQPETLEHDLEVGIIKGFRNGHLHTVGHYTTAPYGGGEGACFFARIGLLLAENGAVGRPPGAIDTVVKATLCGDRIDEEALVEALQKTAVARP